MLIANWVILPMEENTSPWRVMSWRYLCLRISQNLNQLFTVSCLFLARCCMKSVSTLLEMHFGHFTYYGASSIYSSSASTISPSVKWLNREFRKIRMSLNLLHGNGPLIQTILLVKMQIATSYRSLDFMENLWLENAGPSSAILKSVPSTDIKQSLPLSTSKRLSKKIFHGKKKVSQN